MEAITKEKNEGITTLYDETNSTVFWSRGENHLNRIDFELLIPREGIDSDLRWTFSFHIYFFAVTFFILTFYTLASIVNIRNQISRKRFMSGINTFLCIFSFSRAVSLVADPYGSHKNLPSSMMNALWAIGYPSLMSSFCLLQLAFLHLTKLEYGARILRTEIFLRTVITLHIFSSVMRAVISSIHWSVNMVVINYVCEFVFLSWALFIYTSFLFIGYKVFGVLDRVSAERLQPNGCQNRGILQLERLAPPNKIVTSFTAALMPTLLGPAASATTNRASTKALLTKSDSDSSSTTVSGGIDKTKLINSASTSCALRSGSLPSTRLKKIEDTKPQFSNFKKGEISFQKTKKLTWQSSITNDNSVETKLSEEKVSPTIGTIKRPILKDVNRTDILKTRADGIKNVETTHLPLANTVITDDIDDKGSQSNEILLQTILNHIAYVNRKPSETDSGLAHYSHDSTPTSLRRQLRFVLKITYSTAVLGLCLTVAEFFQRFGFYGLMRYFSNDEDIQPWPWLVFQTFCRACELFMGSAIANITKQPAATVHRYYKHNPAIMKQRGSMFM